MPDPLPISIAIVCKDAQRTIARTLDSVTPWAAEIIAVDSGSTDSTLVLLEKAGATIIKSEWLGYVRTKQKALQACSQPWVLCVDADESVGSELHRSIEKLIAEDDPAAAGARVNRKIWYRGRFLEHAWQPEWRLRLVRREQARWGGLDPHDKLEITGDGKAADIEGTLRHDSFERFTDQLHGQTNLARLMAQSLHEQGIKTGRARAVVSAAGAVLKQLVLRSAWRDGTPGWLAAYSSGIYAWSKHLALMELLDEAREQQRHDKEQESTRKRRTDAPGDE